MVLHNVFSLDILLVLNMIVAYVNILFVFSLNCACVHFYMSLFCTFNVLLVCYCFIIGDSLLFSV